MNQARAILLYRATCAKCRGISQVIVWLSLGWVRRIPLSSPEAVSLYGKYGVRPGKLALAGCERMFSGWRTVPALLVIPFLLILSTLRRQVGPNTGRQKSNILQ
jgi:hypothetical protein